VFALQAVERELESIGNTELVKNLIQVVLDDLLGGTEFMGYLLVAHAQRDAGNDRQLLWSEVRQRAGRRRGLRAVGLDHQVDGLVIYPDFSCGDRADALDK